MVTFFIDCRRKKSVVDCKEIKKRKLGRHIVNATDDRKMMQPPNKPAFSFPMDRGSGTIFVYLRKMPGSTVGVVAYNYRVEVK